MPIVCFYSSSLFYIAKVKYILCVIGNHTSSVKEFAFKTNFTGEPGQTIQHKT